MDILCALQSGSICEMYFESVKGCMTRFCSVLLSPLPRVINRN